MSKKPSGGQKQPASLHNLAGERLVDEWDAYSRVFRDVTLWRRVSFALVGAVVLLLGVVVIQAMQPPVVIVKDRARAERPEIVTAGDIPSLTVEDAESFFLYTMRRRFGWESATIMRDWEELYGLMTSEMRTAFNAWANEPVDPATPSPSRGDTKKEPRLLSYMGARVHNELSLHRDNVECRKGEAVHGIDQWYCRALGAIETMPMGVEVREAARVTKDVEFRARFQPAPYDKYGERLWGLGIAYLDAQSAGDSP